MRAAFLKRVMGVAADYGRRQGAERGWAAPAPPTAPGVEIGTRDSLASWAGAAPICGSKGTLGDRDGPGTERFRLLLDEAIAYIAAPGRLGRALGAETRIVLCETDFTGKGNDAATIPHTPPDLPRGGRPITRLQARDLPQRPGDGRYRRAGDDHS